MRSEACTAMKAHSPEVLGCTLCYSLLSGHQVLRGIDFIFRRRNVGTHLLYGSAVALNSIPYDISGVARLRGNVC
jgi:hypothetical protein